MSKIASISIAASIFAVRVRSEAMPAVHATLPSSGTTTWLDDVVGDAVLEAACTLSFFLCIWVGGKSMGWKFGGGNGKKGSKPVKGGVQVARSVSDAKSPKPTAKRIDSHIDVGTTAPSPARASPQGNKRSPTTETDMIAAAVRAGKAAELPRLIDASLARMTKDGSADANEVFDMLFMASLRACAAKRCFTEALALYSHVVARIGETCGSAWSLLLWSAVEAGEYGLGSEFLKRLLEDGHATSYDFVNIVRLYANVEQPLEFAEVVRKIQVDGCQIDLLARNRALSLCTNSHCIALAQQIVKCVPDVPMDAIAHNTMMKAFANVGDLISCFGQYADMRCSNITPTEMTFGILLDACIDDKQLEHARRVFSDLRESGIVLNVILYTTFIKGLVNAGELAEAMAILDEMCGKSTAKPDLVTFSTLVKAHASLGKVMDCVRLLERMVSMGVQPDSVLFNTVLTGCSVRAMEPAQVMHVFSWLLKKGLHPSTATISVLIKAFSLSQSWSHALDILDSAPTRFGIWPEARVYGQLAQSCASQGCGKEALAAYASMVKAAGAQKIALKPVHYARLQRLCEQSSQGARAGRITQALQDAGGRVDHRVRDALEAFS